jgi:hypothetical protein
MSRPLRSSGVKEGMVKKARWLVLVPFLLLLMAAVCCKHEDELSIPEISCTPYVSDSDVFFYRRFEPEHNGIDLGARQEITIRAACSGTFRKELYFHPVSLRWQVNTGIWTGDYSVNGLFEPGSQVSEDVGRAQFAALVADGTQVNAGDSLGRLLLDPWSEYAVFHFGLHRGATGLAECPLAYCSAEVRAQLQALAQRDHPGWEVCVGN